MVVILFRDAYHFVETNPAVDKVFTTTISVASLVGWLCLLIVYLDDNGAYFSLWGIGGRIYWREMYMSNMFAFLLFFSAHLYAMIKLPNKMLFVKIGRCLLQTNFGLNTASRVAVSQTQAAMGLKASAKRKWID